MICKITILSILVSVYESQADENQQYATSSQSFHREDVPLSYKFTAIHNFNDQSNSKKSEKERHIYRQHNLKPVSYNSIQYAPLPYEVKPDDHFLRENLQKRQKSESVSTPVHAIENGWPLYSTKATTKKDHLEPRRETDNLEPRQNPRPFIPGHNFKIVPNSKDRFSEYADLFVAPLQKQKQQIKPPKIVYFFKKPKQQFINSTPAFKMAEELKTSENYNLPRPQLEEFNAPHIVESITYPYVNSLHDALAMEKPQQTYQNGQRLHLNIARYYNMANQQRDPSLHLFAYQRDKTPLLLPLPSTSLAKPSALTKDFFAPNNIQSQKTLEHPFIDIKYQDKIQK